MSKLTLAIKALEKDIEQNKDFAKQQYTHVRLKIKKEISSTKAYLIAFLTGSLIVVSLKSLKNSHKNLAKASASFFLPQKLPYLISNFSALTNLASYFKRYLN